jgi:ribonuclease BN (tRNA processing enzyme)
MSLKMNEITILGAYGTKSKGFGTSAFYLDEKNVIDAGNLLSPLEAGCAKIENIYLTHSHLDHICDIAYIIDNYFSHRTKSLNIIALPETIEAIQKHFLNNKIWPDFSRIALDNSTLMSVSYKEIECGVEYKIDEISSIEAFATDHTVPSCGYIYKKNGSAVLITADTYSLQSALKLIDTREEICSVVVECSFPTEMEVLAKESKHLTPKLLFEKLQKAKRDDFVLYINHIKPLYLEKIRQEIAQYRGKWEPHILKDKEILTF